MSQVCIYPKEAAAVTGNGYQAGKRLLQRIRVQLGKPSRALVSIQEFCAYTHLPEQEVRAALARGCNSSGLDSMMREIMPCSMMA